VRPKGSRLLGPAGGCAAPFVGTAAKTMRIPEASELARSPRSSDERNDGGLDRAQRASGYNPAIVARARRRCLPPAVIIASENASVPLASDLLLDSIEGRSDRSAPSASAGRRTVTSHPVESCLARVMATPWFTARIEIGSSLPRGGSSGGPVQETETLWFIVSWRSRRSLALSP
jgi:hypothetical protein